MADAPTILPVPSGGGFSLKGLLGTLLTSQAGRRAGGGLILGLVWAALSSIYGFASGLPMVFIALIIMAIGLLAPQLFGRIFAFLFLSIAIPAGMIIIASRFNIPIFIVLLAILIYAVALAAQDKEKNGSVKLAGMLLIFIFIGYTLVLVFTPVDNLPFSGAMGEAVRLQKESLVRIGGSLSGLQTGAQEYVSRQVAIASGDYYTSQVDQGAARKLGVFLDAPKAVEPRLYEDQPIGFFSALRAETIENPIDISTTCTVGEGDKQKTGSIEPSFIMVTTQSLEEVRCTFPAGTFEEGTHTLKMTAGFNFQTLAYLRGYFMDDERLSEQRLAADRQSVFGDETVARHILGQYGLTDLRLNGRDTPGPVTVGMGFIRQPVGLDADKTETKVTLGVTVDKRAAWEGKLTELNQIEVTIPRAFEIESVNLRPLSEWGGCEDIDLERVCTLRPPAAAAQPGEDTGYVSLRILLRIPRSSYDDVLSIRTDAGEQVNVPVAIKNFKATARYRYTLERSLVFTVRKPLAEQPAT